MLIIVRFNTKWLIIIIKIRKKLMQEYFEDYEFCINLSLDNAKRRIKILDSCDRKSVLEEYKEWIKDGLNKHNVLLLREDPII